MLELLDHQKPTDSERIAELQRALRRVRGLVGPGMTQERVDVIHATIDLALEDDSV